MLIGGVEEGRTPDLCIANAALCQTELLPLLVMILLVVCGGVKADLLDEGFRIQDLGFKIQDSGFRIQDSGFKVGKCA